MTTDEDRPVHGPPRPDGGLLQAAAEQLHEMFGVHRQLDQVLYESAQRVGGVEFASIFNPIAPEKLAATPRMDAINHDQAFLRSHADVGGRDRGGTRAARDPARRLRRAERRHVRRIHRPREAVRAPRRRSVVRLRGLAPRVPGRRLQPRLPHPRRAAEGLRPPRHAHDAHDRPAARLPRGDGHERDRRHPSQGVERVEDVPGERRRSGQRGRHHRRGSQPARQELPQAAERAHPVGVPEPHDLRSRPHRDRSRERLTRREGRERLRRDGAVRAPEPARTSISRRGPARRSIRSSATTATATSRASSSSAPRSPASTARSTRTRSAR